MAMAAFIYDFIGMLEGFPSWENMQTNVRDIYDLCPHQQKTTFMLRFSDKIINSKYRLL